MLFPQALSTISEISHPFPSPPLFLVLSSLIPTLVVIYFPPGMASGLFSVSHLFRTSTLYSPGFRKIYLEHLFPFSFFSLVVFSRLPILFWRFQRSDVRETLEQGSLLTFLLKKCDPLPMGVLSCSSLFLESPPPSLSAYSLEPAPNSFFGVFFNHPIDAGDGMSCCSSILDGFPFFSVLLFPPKCGPSSLSLSPRCVSDSDPS